MAEEEVFWGVPLSDFIVSCVLLVLFVILPFVVPPLFRWILHIVDRLDGEIEHSYFEEDLLRLLPYPISVVCQAVILYVVLELLRMPEEVEEEVQTTTVILIVLSVLFLGSRVVDVLTLQIPAPKLSKFKEEKLGQHPDGVSKVFSKLFKTVLLGLILLVGLEAFGVPVVPLITGLGIGGIALGMAAKDFLSNMFGTLIIYLDDPFRLHDWIDIGGTSGQVVSIGLRTSKIRTPEGEIVTVPNQDFASKHVINVFRKEDVRIKFQFKVATSGDVAGFLKDVRQSLVKFPGIRLLNPQDPRQSCAVVAMDGYSATVELYVRFPLGNMAGDQEVKNMEELLGMPEPVEGVEPPSTNDNGDKDIETISGDEQRPSDVVEKKPKGDKKKLLGGGEEDVDDDDAREMRRIPPEPSWNYFASFRYVREDLNLLLVEKMKAHNCVLTGEKLMVV